MESSDSYDSGGGGGRNDEGIICIEYDGRAPSDEVVGDGRRGAVEFEDDDDDEGVSVDFDRSGLETNSWDG